MIVKKRTVISSTDKFRLVKQERSGTKIWYEIECTLGWWERTAEHDIEMKEFFAAAGSSGKHPERSLWSYWDHDQASQAFLMATLKF